LGFLAQEALPDRTLLKRSDTSDAVLRFTGKKPLNLEEYFTLFPGLLQPLRLGQDHDSRI
jgi:hypothetical protein